MSITNTTKGDPLAMLFDAMVHGSDGAILRQEASGQRELVNSDVLPADIRNRDDFARLGFKFGAPVDGDPLFIHAALPDGWTRQGSDHAMWSYLLDDKGRRRVGVFYKAAFYDRSAHMGLERRYGVGRDYDAPAGVVVVHVKDHDGSVLWTSETATETDRQAFYATQDRLEAQAHAWLDANRPKWRDAVAAWDE